MQSPYAGIISAIKELERNDRYAVAFDRITDYIQSIEKTTMAALKASETSGNTVQAMELRADLRTIRRIKDFVDNVWEN